MAGRRLTAQDMHEAKRLTRIRNSQIKRGDLPKSANAQTRHCVCGCGAKGCIFISNAQ